MRDPGRWRRGVRFILRQLAEGALEVPIERVFDFGAAADLHRKLESRSVSGKLLLKVG
jgi:NADPH:quinone reductase-like Zn-dependent oxidoreductase